jgi:hypothetical protein
MIGGLSLRRFFSSFRPKGSADMVMGTWLKGEILPGAMSGY